MAVQWALNVWSTNGPLSIPLKSYKKVSKLVVWRLNTYRWVVSRADQTPPWICDMLHGLKQSFLYQFFNLVCAALTRQFLTLVAVIVCSISSENASHNDYMTGMICKGGTAHGLLCWVTYWITFGMKFQCHNVMSVPSGSWLFLMLLPGCNSVEPWVDEAPTVSTFEGAQEGVWDVEQDLWYLGGRVGVREAPWTVCEVRIPAGL